MKDPENMKHLEHQLSPPKIKAEVQISTPVPPPQTPTQPPPTHNGNFDYIINYIYNIFQQYIYVCVMRVLFIRMYCWNL